MVLTQTIYKLWLESVGCMAVGTLQIQIPIRALWWVKKVAGRERKTGEKWAEELILRKLQADERVDLSRAPTMEE
jgi:hypothetical protein